MATPDIRIDWRGDGFSAITNEAFVTDTSGWSVAAGINAAATSITRVTGDGVLGGVTTNTCASLVTTATNGSGTNFDFGTTTFTSGRTYRFAVWIKSVSGTTAARILLGSLGTVGDRASATMTITTSWVRYTVAWTPSGTRTDVEAIVTNNAASVMTARLCLAEVFETIDDVGVYGDNEVTELSWSRGANFDGSAESPGACSMTVNNITQKYAPDNGSSALAGLLTTGKPVMVRAIDALVYGAFAGTLRRLVPLPVDRTAQLLCEDKLYDLSIAEVSIAASVSTDIHTLRGAILDQVGWTSVQRNLATGSPENHVPLTEADQRSALDVLAELNLATGTIHYIRPHPVPSIGWVYTTFDRTQAQSSASVETIDDNTTPGITGLDAYDVTDETLVTRQTVHVTTRTIGTASTVWTSDDLPFSVPPSTTRDLWASFDDPVFDQVIVYSATNAPTVTLTPYSRSAKITITAGGTAAYFTDLSITGEAAAVYGEGFEQTGTGSKRAELSSDFIEKRATAKGLADYIIARYGTEKPRPSLTITNRMPSQVTRDVSDTVSVNFGLLSIVANRYQIRSLATVVTQSALQWDTTWSLEEALGDTELFTIGGSAAEGVGGTGILAY
jgi:hypothetical protein